MSAPVQEVWPDDKPLGSRCNTSTLLDHLDRETELLAHGQLVDGGYTDRDRDRARICKYLVQEGRPVLRTTVVHHVLKGVRRFRDGPGWHDDLDGNALEEHTKALDEIAARKESVADDLDGSDPDYRFAYRFSRTLASQGYIRLEDSPAGILLAPELKLLDLISEGVSKISGQSNEVVYDRQFCENVLKNVRSRDLSLSDAQKDLLANSLRRYIRRVDDYRMLFDVHLTGFRGIEENHQMYSDYKTRFTDRGRQDKAFARLQAALEYAYSVADTAVFATLTTDPKKFDSLWDAIKRIQKNYNNLRNYLSSDPETVADTRRASVSSWSKELDSSNYNYFPDGNPTGGPPEGPVSGRPRENLEYISVLEFDSAGKPHLHVLFLDPPKRETDGMPFLIDKAELSEKWKQGQIVDLFPLVYRDDLDELPAEFGTTVVHDENGDPIWTDSMGVRTDPDDPDGSPKTEPVSEGFVSWYRYGDHGHSDEWIEKRSRFHKEDGLIDMDGSDDRLQEKTAGSYIGKYISKMYETLYAAEDLDASDWDHDQKAAWWKLALYWTTGKHFWNISHGIRDAIALDRRDPEVDRGVRECATVSALEHAKRAAPEHDRRRCQPTNEEWARSRMRPALTTIATVQYRGTYAVWDLPPKELGAAPLETVTGVAYGDDAEVTISRGDRPPPIADLYG